MRPARTLFAAVSLLAFGCATTSTSSGSAQGGGENAAVVRGFIEAFNRHDPEGMAALAHAEIEWVDIRGASTELQARGADALQSAMQAYFATQKDVASRLEQVTESGRYVTAREHVRWTTAQGEPQAQSAFSVWQVEDGKIRRVYYFDAER